MDRRFNGSTVPSSPGGAGAASRSSYPHPQPDYSRPKVQEALRHLASIDLIDLCKEAKVERCRATRDLGSCGRDVHHVLIPCGHASLCAECSQRFDACPICRNPMAKGDIRLRLRLYYECIEAGLISKRYDERFQKKEDGDKLLTADVEHLYSFFDIALENNLISLVCHYVTDVCMDESAVSSDPILAFLLDEVVVKDWCSRTFKNILVELQITYNLNIQEMKGRLTTLLKFIVYLAAISNVLEVLESSFKGTLSAQSHDFHHLQESILRTKQHLEMIVWCIRHQFLEEGSTRHGNYASWSSVVRERKAAAIKRAWPEPVNNSMESLKQDKSLFIEDALANLDMDEGSAWEMGNRIELASLQKHGFSSVFRAKIEGMVACYPFENIRAAVDLLFLHGSSDLIVAKQAIFLYYLFDSYWTRSDNRWREIVDDFASTFGITRHSVLESLVFYLLDDHMDEALEEACCLLPDIAGSAMHPKIAEVLLERNRPDVALMVLHWSGRDVGIQVPSLREAVTAVRVRIECGLLTEAFMHQRMLSSRVKEKKPNYTSGNATDNLRVVSNSFDDWVEVLVTETCCLCIRRNLVDRMIELPWNEDEERYIYSCLFDYAAEEPLRTTGNLLVVYYIQRYRYAEAYQVHLKLQKLEQTFTSESSHGEDILSRMRVASQWRGSLVDKCLDLLPEVEQRQLKSVILPDVAANSHQGQNSDSRETVDSGLTSLLLPSTGDTSGLLPTHHTTGLLTSSVLRTPARPARPVNVSNEITNFDSALEQLTSHSSMKKKITYGSSLPPNSHQISYISGSPQKMMNRVLPRNRQDSMFDAVSPKWENNGFHGHVLNTGSAYTQRDRSNSVMKHTSNPELVKDFPKARRRSPHRSVLSDREDISWNKVSTDDPMDISSYIEKDSIAKVRTNGRGRWRSDETSDEDGDDQAIGSGMSASRRPKPLKAVRSRFSKKDSSCLL